MVLSGEKHACTCTMHYALMVRVLSIDGRLGEIARLHSSSLPCPRLCLFLIALPFFASLFICFPLLALVPLSHIISPLPSSLILFNPTVTTTPTLEVSSCCSTVPSTLLRPFEISKASAHEAV